MKTLDRKLNFFKLIRFAFPSMIMMVVMSVYTVVDGVFVSVYVGTDALSSVNIILPLYSLLLAIGIMFGTGGTAYVSKLLGQGKQVEAKRAFTLIIISAVALTSAIALLIYAFNESIFRMLGADDVLLPYCKEYFLILLIFTAPIILQVAFQDFMIANGKPVLGFILTIAAGLANVLLDYVFIVVCNMGIKGAAIATGIGNTIAAVGGLIYFSVTRGSLKFAIPKVNIKCVLLSCYNGSSEMVSNISNAIVIMVFNLYMMKTVGSDGVAAVTIICYAQFLINALYIGFSIGVAPIIGYNYGARELKYLNKMLTSCYLFVLGSSVVLFLISYFSSGVLTSVFSSKGSAVQILAEHGMKLFSIGFIFSGLNIFTSAMYTALSNGKISALISFMRTLFFTLISLYSLTALFGIDGLWLAIPVAEFVTLIGCIAITIFKHKRGTLYAIKLDSPIIAIENISDNNEGNE